MTSSHWIPFTIWRISAALCPGGVHAADQAAHAGAGNVVHRYVMFLQPGNDTNVGQAERSAALQYQADLGPRPRSPERFGSGQRWRLYILGRLQRDCEIYWSYRWCLSLRVDGKTFSIAPNQEALLSPSSRHPLRTCHRSERVPIVRAQQVGAA